MSSGLKVPVIELCIMCTSKSQIVIQIMMQNSGRDHLKLHRFGMKK